MHVANTERPLKPSDLCLLPPEWRRARFDEICTVRQGLQIAISDRLSKPTPTSKEYITIQSINKSQQDREYIESPSSRVVCSKDDILMTRTGNTGIVVTDVEGVFHNNFFLIDFDRNQSDKKFLVEYLRLERIQHVIFTKAGASTIPDMNHKDFYSIEVPVPPLPEQQKIAQILSTWDKAIEKLEALIAAKGKRKKALMQQLLIGKMRFTGFSGEWKKVTLLHIAKVTMGSSPKSGAYNDDCTGLPLIQGNADIKNRLSAPRIYTAEITKECRPKDILMSVRAPVGAIAKSIHQACIGRGICAITAKNGVDQHFLYYWLLAFESRWESLSQGSTFESVNSADIKSLAIYMPIEETEQQKITSVLSAADKEITIHQNQLAALKQQKKGLMQQLLTGKKRVNVNQAAA